MASLMYEIPVWDWLFGEDGYKLPTFEYPDPEHTSGLSLHLAFHGFVCGNMSEEDRDRMTSEIWDAVRKDVCCCNCSVHVLESRREGEDVIDVELRSPREIIPGKLWFID